MLSQQFFNSRLSSLYPDDSDDFFTHPQRSQQSQQQQQVHPRSPTRDPTLKTDKPVEEHKYPEPSSSTPQTKEHTILQPHRQHSDLVASQQQPSPVHHDPFDLFGDMDSLFDAQMQRMGRMMDRFGGSAMLGGLPALSDLPTDGANGATYSYTSSSSSYSANDGSNKPFYRHAAHTTQSVNGVSSSRSRYSDSLGNHREQRGWGLGNQHREICIDRNAKGEERQRENLKELQPEQVEQFTQKWEQQRAAVDPKHKLIREEDEKSSRKAIKPTEPSARKQVKA